MRLLENKKQKQYREQYLTSSHWQSLRARLYTPYASCKICGKRKFLNIHHLTYKNRGHENIEDLVILCRIHHLEIHKGIISLNQEWIKPKKVPTISFGKFKSEYLRSLMQHNYSDVFRLIPLVKQEDLRYGESILFERFKKKLFQKMQPAENITEHVPV